MLAMMIIMISPIKSWQLNQSRDYAQIHKTYAALGSSVSSALNL